jgi:3',5'-cyclic AMP phosphodiesterase CpdA
LACIASLAQAAMGAIEDTAITAGGLVRSTRDSAGLPEDGQRIRIAPQACTRVVILPDRTSGNDAGLKYVDEAVEDINRLRPDAVIAIGDMVQGYTRNPDEWNRQASDHLARVNRLKVPFLPLAGNHDVISGSRTAGDRSYERMYRERYGPRWYRADFEHLVALVLDSDEPCDGRNPGLGTAQVQWLTGELESLRDDPRARIVLVHRPLWRTGSARKEWDSAVHPALVRAKVDAVIAGHLHALQMDEPRDGITYMVVGTCGGHVDQLPLAGQLHHLTVLNACGGDVALSHVPVGATIADDFVRSADQELAYTLKRVQSLAFDGALPESAPAGTRAQVSCLVSNPLNVPIRVRLEPEPEAPQPEPAGGSERFLSDARADLVNRFTWHASSPWVLEPVAEFSVGPRSELRVPVSFRARADAVRSVAPLIAGRATFTDSRDRPVDVILRARPPIQRALGASRDPSARWPISAWPWTPYDTPEPDGSLRWWRDSADEVWIEVTMPDALATGDAGPAASPQSPALHGSDANPHNDAVRIELKTDAGIRSWLAEPHASRAYGDPIVSEWSAQRDIVADTAHGPLPGWTVRVRLEPGAAKAAHGLNAFVADNDFTYHTQWRSLCPPGSYASLDAISPSALNTAQEAPAAASSQSSPPALPARTSP